MLELLLAGHITTDMQASCQTGDYVSLEALSNNTASEVALPSFSLPKCCQQMHNAGSDGWVERGGGCCIFTLRVLSPFWLATPVMLSEGLTEEENSDILLGKVGVSCQGQLFFLRIPVWCF